MHDFGNVVEYVGDCHHIHNLWKWPNVNLCEEIWYDEPNYSYVTIILLSFKMCFSRIWCICMLDNWKEYFFQCFACKSIWKYGLSQILQFIFYLYTSPPNCEASTSSIMLFFCFFTLFDCTTPNSIISISDKLSLITSPLHLWCIYSNIWWTRYEHYTRSSLFASMRCNSNMVNNMRRFWSGQACTKTEKARDLVDFIWLGGNNRGGRWTETLYTSICMKINSIGALS